MNTSPRKRKAQAHDWIRTALHWASALAVCVGPYLAPIESHAQGFPVKPVTIVVPFPPGGTSDTAARQTALPLAKALKQSVVILNKPGAGGSLGTASVANGERDGYTLLMGLSSISTAPEAERIAGRKPLYEVKQLEPIARISADPLLLVVREDSRYKSLRDLVDDARSRPGKVVYASSGNYGPNHVAIEMLADTARMKLHHVPYSGGSGTVTALLGNQVDFTLMGPSVALSQLKAGKIRALAVYASTRLPMAPDVPTLKEGGFDVEYYIWSGLFAPSGTPPAVLSVLRDAVGKAVKDAQFLGSMASVEMPAAYLDAPEFKEFVDQDAARLVDVVRKIGKID